MKLKLTKNQWIIIIAVAAFIVYWFYIRKKKTVVAEKIDTTPPIIEKATPSTANDLNSIISQSMANKGTNSEVGYTRFGDMCPEGMTYDQTTYKCSPKMESGYANRMGSLGNCDGVICPPGQICQGGRCFPEGRAVSKPPFFNENKMVFNPLLGRMVDEHMI